MGGILNAGIYGRDSEMRLVNTPANTKFGIDTGDLQYDQHKL